MAVTDVQAEEEDALRSGKGALWLERDVVRVSGPDATSFLQGQLSQDIAAIAVDGSALSLVLQPTGKVDALVRVCRPGSDTYLLDVDGGFGEALVARLQRFKLRVKAEIGALPGWRCLRVPGNPEVGVSSGPELVVAPTGWPALGGVDLLGPAATVPDGLRMCGPAAYEAVRILARVPRMGAELTERTIPAEAGVVELTVSFTKGCFTGQELVARIDSRGGHVPRHLRLLRGEPGELPVPPAGAEVRLEGRAVGSVTSSARSASEGCFVALAYLHRDVVPPQAVELAWDGGTAAATAVAVAVAEP